MKFSAVVFLYLYSLNLYQECICGTLDKQESLKVTEEDASKNETNLTKGNNATENSLVCVQAIWRHGSRNQLFTFPKDEHSPNVTKMYGDEGWEQLTLGGVISSQALGKHLRFRYDNFLSKNFSLSELFLISSGTHRTVMTALSVAQGLFPTIVATSEKDSSPLWYPVPVMTVPRSMDNYILQMGQCKRHAQLYDEYKNSSKINNGEALDLYKYLAIHSGQPIQNYDDVSQLYDTIFTVQRNVFGIPVPEWASSVENQMFNMARFIFYGFVDSFEMMKFIAGPLLYKIVHNFNCTLGIQTWKPEIGEECKYTKMYAFSGHDTTISPLLYLFEHYNIDSPPPFNALLLFELHLNQTEYFIKIFYRPKNENGEDSTTELLLKSCGGVPCEFKKFQEIYKDYIIDDATWQKECDDIEYPVDRTIEIYDL